MKIELDMYQTLALAVLVLMLGKFLRERVRLLDKFCIPAPVIGGVLFAVFTCLCYVTGIAEFEFDDILKEVCMVFFFTSVGFQANLKVLKSGGKAMIVFLGVVIVLIVSAGTLAFIVLYNLTNINIAERERELATIKVLGFHDGEVSAYIYRETALLSLIGMALGLAFGVVLHAFVVRTAEIDAVMFGRSIAPLSFVYAGLLTLVFTAIVSLFMHKKLKKIDMVQSLKSNE